MTDLLYREEVYMIQGAVFNVYRELGAGFLEAVYQECLEKELSLNLIPYVSQPELNIIYRGEQIDQTYKPDLICYGKIILELKAVKELCTQHEAQVFNYLKATELRLGLLINFGHYPKVQIKRIII